MKHRYKNTYQNIINLIQEHVKSIIHHNHMELTANIQKT